MYAAQKEKAKHHQQNKHNTTNTWTLISLDVKLKAHNACKPPTTTTQTKDNRIEICVNKNQSKQHRSSHNNNPTIK